MPELKWSIGKLWEHWPVKEGRKRSEREGKLNFLLDPSVFFYSFELNVFGEEIKLNWKPADEDPAQVFSNFSSISIGLKFK
ncbi:unnamed protein product, partial [Porites evermanni]